MCKRDHNSQQQCLVITCKAGHQTPLRSSRGDSHVCTFVPHSVCGGEAEIKRDNLNRSGE